MRAVSKLQAECADGLESVRIYTDLIERTACRMRGSSAKSVRQSQNPSQVKANTAATYQWGLLPLRKICVYKLGQVALVTTGGISVSMLKNRVSVSTFVKKLFQRTDTWSGIRFRSGS